MEEVAINAISATAEGGASAQNDGKKRVRQWTARDRAKHRVFEKDRREAFNKRLTELAKSLPALGNAKETQLSKHIIIDESVKRHKAQQSTIDSLTERVDKLLAERDELLAEINMWRDCVNVPPRHTHFSGDIDARDHFQSNLQALALDGSLPLPTVGSDIYDNAQGGPGLANLNSLPADVQFATTEVFESGFTEASNTTYVLSPREDPPNSQLGTNMATFENTSDALPEPTPPPFQHQFQAAVSSSEPAAIHYVSRSLVQNGEVAEPFRDGRGSFVNFATSRSRPGVYLLEK